MHTTAAQMQWRATKTFRTEETEIPGKCEVNPDFSVASFSETFAKFLQVTGQTAQPHTEMKFRAIKQAALEGPELGK